MQRGSSQTGGRLGGVVQKIRKYEIDSDRPNFHESMYICVVATLCAEREWRHILHELFSGTSVKITM